MKYPDRRMFPPWNLRTEEFSLYPDFGAEKTSRDAAGPGEDKNLKPASWMPMKRR